MRNGARLSRRRLDPKRTLAHHFRPAFAATRFADKSRVSHRLRNGAGGRIRTGDLLITNRDPTAFAILAGRPVRIILEVYAVITDNTDGSRGRLVPIWTLTALDPGETKTC